MSFETSNSVVRPEDVLSDNHISVNFHATLEINGIGSEYELFHCLSCGTPWDEHTLSCFNHKNKEKCIHVRNLVKDTPEAQRLFAVAIKDGFDANLIGAEL